MWPGAATVCARECVPGSARRLWSCVACLRVCVFFLVLYVCLCVVHPSVIWALLLRVCDTWSYACQPRHGLAGAWLALSRASCFPPAPFSPSFTLALPEQKIDQRYFLNCKEKETFLQTASSQKKKKRLPTKKSNHSQKTHQNKFKID